MHWILKERIGLQILDVFTTIHLLKSFRGFLTAIFAVIPKVLNCRRHFFPPNVFHSFLIERILRWVGRIFILYSRSFQKNVFLIAQCYLLQNNFVDVFQIHILLLSYVPYLHHSPFCDITHRPSVFPYTSQSQCAHNLLFKICRMRKLRFQTPHSEQSYQIFQFLP